MEFLTVRQTAMLLRWTQGEVLAALRTGVLAGVQVPKTKTKWAVVHPGVMFVEYLRNPDARLPHISVFTIEDIAYITGQTVHSVAYYISKLYIEPLRFGSRRHIRKRTPGTLYSPWQVRKLIAHISKGKADPFTRPPLTTEIMKQAFEKSMIAKVPADPLERLKAELEWICRMPEPERSQELNKLMHQADEIYKKQQEELKADCNAAREPNGPCAATSALPPAPTVSLPSPDRNQPPSRPISPGRKLQGTTQSSNV